MIKIMNNNVQIWHFVWNLTHTILWEISKSQWEVWKKLENMGGKVGGEGRVGQEGGWGAGKTRHGRFCMYSRMQYSQYSILCTVQLSDDKHTARLNPKNRKYDGSGEWLFFVLQFSLLDGSNQLLTIRAVFGNIILPSQLSPVS